jgi:glycosyltransferase involved in cell wall biosynthesis
VKTLQIGLEWFSERAGGVARYYCDLFQRAPEAGIGFRGLVIGTESVAQESGGAVCVFSPRERPVPARLLAARRAIARRLREEAPDLVVSHFALHAFPALDLIDRPLVCHFHGPWAEESGDGGRATLAIRAKAWIEAAVYRRARLNIVLSKAFGEILRRSYGVPWERIRVIPGAVDVDRFAVLGSRAEARARLGWPSDRPIVLAVRRLVRRMGLENLIRAMRDVARQCPEALLLIGGKGPLAGELAALVVELGLETNVRLLGFIPDDALPLAYRAADVSVVPTAALEGFGLIAAESLAAGTPALVTPVGGLPEVVGDLSPGLVMEGAAVECLSSAIGDVLSGVVELPTFAQCREFARDRYSWRVVAARIGAAYREAI